MRLLTKSPRHGKNLKKKCKFYVRLVLLIQKLIVKSFNVGTFLDGMESTSKSAVRRSQTNTIRKAQYEGNCLIVVKTDDNRQELNIVFPLINEQTVQQTNTFKCIAEMLQCNNFGLLKYRLRLQ